MVRVKFGDLAREYDRLVGAEIECAIIGVLKKGWFVLGPELEAFEQAFAGYLNIEHCVGVASGTEALALGLLACGVGPGDEVVTVAHTAVPTVSAISMIGAQPLFVDIQLDTGLMDVGQLETVITPRTRAIIPVHLYGQCVDMDPLLRIAAEHDIPVIEDAAQAHGAKYKGRLAGTMGAVGCFSFYPSKNLGCYGDGGAITTTDEALFEQLVMLRNYGQTTRYYHEIVGMNSRLDEIQATILRVKLHYLDEWNARRREIGRMYHEALSLLPLTLPTERPANEHVYHLYVIQTARRDALQAFLADRGIQSLIHYPVPVHLQEAYHYLGYEPGSLPVTEQFAQEILSLPMHPHMEDLEVGAVIGVIREFYG